MSFRLVSAILRGPWLIEPDFAQAHLPFVQNLISGNFDGFEYKPNKNSEVFAVNTFKANRSYSTFNDAPKGSIAVIPVTGPILKHDNCGDPGSMTRARQIKEANDHPNIDAIIFDMDSPGGMVDGTQTFADAIKSTTKPTIAIINDGMSASAAYWLASQCDEIYVSRKTDMVGSIGVYLTFADFTKMYEDKGVKIHEIYAPQSTEKNQDFKEAKKGNYKLVEEELRFIADTFINAVKEGRGSKLNLSAGDPFKGKMFFADDAQAIGLIDGIKTMDEVIARAAELSQTSNHNSNNNTNASDMNKKEFAAINAALGVTTLEATEEGVFLNEEQLTAIEAGLTPDATLVTAEAHQVIVDGLATANAGVEATNVELRAAATNAGIEIAEGDFNASAVITALSARITELKATSTEKHTETNAEGDSVAASADAMAVLKSLPHNKED